MHRMSGDNQNSSMNTSFIYEQDLTDRTGARPGRLAGKRILIKGAAHGIGGVDLPALAAAAVALLVIESALRASWLRRHP